MNTGSQDERMYLNNVRRIADALERIARCVESRTFGATAEDVRQAEKDLEADVQRRGEAAYD